MRNCLFSTCFLYAEKRTNLSCYSQIIRTLSHSSKNLFFFCASFYPFPFLSAAYPKKKELTLPFLPKMSNRTQKLEFFVIEEENRMYHKNKSFSFSRKTSQSKNISNLCILPSDPCVPTSGKGSGNWKCLSDTPHLLISMCLIIFRNVIPLNNNSLK